MNTINTRYWTTVFLLLISQVLWGNNMDSLNRAENYYESSLKYFSETKDLKGMTGVTLVFGINDCGDGNPSEALEITVEGPNPEITGEEIVCDCSDEVYQVTENDGSTYSWNVTGGTIAEGQGTYMITVAWAGEGTGTVRVEEETETGCSGSSGEFDVTIDNCTGITKTVKNEAIKVYPNPATGTLNIQFINRPELKTGLKIINQLGQVVYNIHLISTGNTFTQAIDISQLPKGIYFLYIKSGNSPDTHHRFVKQ